MWEGIFQSAKTEQQTQDATTHGVVSVPPTPKSTAVTKVSELQPP